MNTELFLAQKLRKTKGKTFSSSVINIGVASIAIGVAAVLISFSVLMGFKNTIKEKLFSMSGHLQVRKITLNQSFDEAPFSNSLAYQKLLEENENIASINAIGLKSALLKSENEISGILLKGIDQNYNSSFFENNLIEGRFIDFDPGSYSKEIIISETQRRLLDVNLGDDLLIYFIQQPPRARKVTIVGVYSTGIEDIDKSNAMVDLNLIRRINEWDSLAVGHSEVFLNELDKADETVNQLYEVIPQDLEVRQVSKMMPAFFDWFNLLDRNIVIVIFLIVIVASFNMVSVLLIMIMERTPMIGLLKSLGAKNGLIQRIFIANAIQIIMKGLILGNALAISLCLLQDRLKLIPLDPQSYYMDYVPVSWDWLVFFQVNLATILIVGLIVSLPTWAILKITPVKALKYKE
ncbi:ABC transporter permease [Jiulongibacter sediminis]|uniref:ABC transporter permease n=1 Tax=Jiulongibacter sediminis TaxID=1605367 RepID=A0A0P7C7M2_9BACT|nr:FtsX-like permease family protein [Jiulongibacter sediminis]KPM49561.1 ABC transporter permease [Jiulongibacter sediminis]TBX26601.1 ABC transporter permease [Jiulongibacter sediminis]